MIGRPRASTIAACVSRRRSSSVRDLVCWCSDRSRAATSCLRSCVSLRRRCRIASSCRSTSRRWFRRSSTRSSTGASGVQTRPEAETSGAGAVDDPVPLTGRTCAGRRRGRNGRKRDRASYALRPSCRSDSAAVRHISLAPSGLTTTEPTMATETPTHRLTSESRVVSCTPPFDHSGRLALRRCWRVSASKAPTSATVRGGRGLWW